MNTNTEDILTEWEKHLIRLARSQGTIEQRVGDARRLLAQIGPIERITRKDLEQHIDQRSGSWSPAYRKKVYTSYRLFFTWAKQQKLILKHPARKLATIKVPRGIPRPAPESVVLSAFDNATNVESAMLCLGATQGLRRSEIAGVHPKNRNGIFLTVLGKGNKERVVALDPLTAALLDELEAEQGRESYYFPGRFGGHLHPATVYKWLKRHLGTDWSTHNLRHRAATIGLRATKDIRGVQEMLGHASLETTQIYTDVKFENLSEIVAATSLKHLLVERRLSEVAMKAPELISSGDEDVIRALQTLRKHMNEHVPVASHR